MHTIPIRSEKKERNPTVGDNEYSTKSDYLNNKCNTVHTNFLLILRQEQELLEYQGTSSVWGLIPLYYTTLDYVTPLGLECPTLPWVGVVLTGSPGVKSDVVRSW